MLKSAWNPIGKSRQPGGNRLTKRRNRSDISVACLPKGSERSRNQIVLFSYMLNCRSGSEGKMGRKIVAVLILIVIVGAVIVGGFTFGRSIIATITKSTTPNTTTTTTTKNPTYVDSLTLYSVKLVSSQNATVVLSNYGNGTATLGAYYVLDSGGNQYARMSWSAPSIPPHSDSGSMSILIGPTCPNCILTGSAFQFYNVTTYMIKFVDSGSNLWTFQFNYVPNSN